MNSIWSFGPETAKWCFHLYDLDIWPGTSNVCMDITSVIGNNWTFHDDTMTGTMCNRRTDRETGGRTDGRAEVFLELFGRN